MFYKKYVAMLGSVFIQLIRKEVTCPAEQQGNLSNACVTKDNLDDTEDDSSINAERLRTEEKFYAVERQLQFAICSASTKPHSTH